MYFNDQTATIEAPSPDNFSHWVVNGVQIRDAHLHITLQKDIEITAVFLQPTAP